MNNFLVALGLLDSKVYICLVHNEIKAYKRLDDCEGVIIKTPFQRVLPCCREKWLRNALKGAELVSNKRSGV